MTPKRTARTTSAPTAIFARTAGGRLRIQRDLLKSLALDTRVLRLNTSLKNLEPFVAGAQSAWKDAFCELGCGACRSKSPTIFLRELLEESYQMKLHFPAAFIKRLWQLQTRELIWVCRCNRLVSPRPYEGFPEDFVQCAIFMEWSFWLVRSWDGQYFELYRPSPSAEVFQVGDVCSNFVRAAIDIWRSHTARLNADQIRQSPDLRLSIAESVNASGCGANLNLDKYR
jgi:hypothetical protein